MISVVKEEGCFEFLFTVGRGRQIAALFSGRMIVASTNVFLASDLRTS